MILLTGASGFIGKHLLSALIRSYGKDEVLAFTSVPLEDCHYLLHNNYHFEPDYFKQAGYASQIETIIHAGAFTPKNGKQGNDRRSCNSNIFNTEKLLDAELPVLKKIIYLSTLDVYGKADVISESSTAEPVSLYGDSKLYTEKMIAAWAKTANAEYQVLRVGHVYGPGEEAYQKIIPVTISRLLRGEAPQIWGTGNEIRSFIYIGDIIKAILQAVKLEKNAGVINLTGSEQITVNELVVKLITLSGTDIEPERIATNMPGRNLLFDSSKLRSLLLSQEISLDTGLAEEWSYMKKSRT